ncbi:MAG: 4Fe-4S ferredoxin [Bilophila wadsworthia]
MLMINTILRNFLKRPATRKYPMVKRDPFSNYRGRLINNVESCIFCRMCSTKCPAQCISTDPKEAFWGYDPFSCVYAASAWKSARPRASSCLDPPSPVPTKFVVYHKGTARVAKPRLACAQGRPKRSAFRNAIEEPKPTPMTPPATRRQKEE